MLLPERLSFSRRTTGAVAKGLFLLALFAGHLTLPALAESEAYVPYSGILHGTDGADPIEVSVANETDVTLDCHAALAHWYSDELGRIAPGDELTLTLWHDSETGVLNRMNVTGDRMPVQALWCASDAARTRLDLPLTAGEMETALNFSCRASDDRGLSCEATGG